MTLKTLKQKRWFHILSNKYLLISLGFAVWLLFFDSNSWLAQRELNREISTLKENKAYYKKGIQKDSALLHQLKKPGGLEKYARENYFMKRQDEEVYIVKHRDDPKKR